MDEIEWIKISKRAIKFITLTFKEVKYLSKYFIVSSSFLRAKVPS